MPRDRVTGSTRKPRALCARLANDQTSSREGLNSSRTAMHTSGGAARERVRGDLGRHTSQVSKYRPFLRMEAILPTGPEIAAPGAGAVLRYLTSGRDSLPRTRPWDALPTAPRVRKDAIARTSAGGS